MKKLINVLLLGVLMAPVPALAAVTVSIDNLTDKNPTDKVTIPVHVTGFTDFTAGRLTLNTGKVCLDTVKVVAGNGTLYPNGLADWSAITSTTDEAYPGEWITGATPPSTGQAYKNAAVDAGQVGNTTTIYFYAPGTDTDNGAAAANGILFNITANVCAGTGDDVTLGGSFYTNAKHTDKMASSVYTNAAITMAGGSYTPPKDATQIVTGEKVTGNVVIPAPSNPAVPEPVGVAFTMESSNPVGEAKVTVSITADLKITDQEGKPYTGLIKPPTVEVASTEEKANFAKTWRDDTDLVKLSIGVPGVHLTLSSPQVVILDIVRATNAPAFKVYYVPETGAPELAGIDGKDAAGSNYVKGGTVLSSEKDTPAAGKTTYHIGLLLDHMSDYVAASILPATSTGASDSSSGCFIATAAFGSPIEPQVETLRAFRDQYLMTNAPGKAFVHTYYQLSPPMADFIAQHDTLRSMTRGALMPLVGVSSLMLYTGMGWTGLAFCLLGLAGLMLTGTRIVSRDKKE